MRNFSAVFGRIAILFLLSVFCGSQADAQEGNYPNFDRKKWHFGFSLGGNTADFTYRLKKYEANDDSILSISIRKQPGFNLGIVGSWDPHPTFHVRFIPSLSFQERLFRYDFIRNGEADVRENRLESTNLDFPILLQFRTKRIVNFAAYGITGLQYSLDLATQEDAAQVTSDPFVKVKQHDFAYQVGGGFDFWLEYFKFGIELKLSKGLRNVLIQDDSFYLKPLESLKQQVWWFSLTFEG
jgi:hypothetical protein